MDGEEVSPKGRPILSDAEVEELVRIPKYIPDSVKDPFKPKTDGAHFRSAVNLICEDQRYKFTLSTRKLIKDPMDFSVIVIYKDINGRKYIIRRYNGDHGRHYHKDTGLWISGPHIHSITERAQREYHKDETEAAETDRYKTLEQAIEVAMEDMNVVFERNKGNADLRKWME